MTRILDLRNKSRYLTYINEAAQALRDSKVIAFPTETVYGLGANADDDDAVEYLYEIKQRPRGKKMTILILDERDIKDYVALIRPESKRLMDRFWPGPLTLIMPSKRGGEIGLRMPAHKVAADLLSISKISIAAPSANISGQPPATNAREVFEIFKGKIEIILDDETKPIGLSSTVVRVGDEGVEILRHGAIPDKDIYDCLKEGGREWIT